MEIPVILAAGKDHDRYGNVFRHYHIYSIFRNFHIGNQKSRKVESGDHSKKRGEFRKARRVRNQPKIRKEMKTTIRIFHWLPRIICILAILFISMFAADAFSPGPTIWQQLRDFLMHLIPSFVLVAALIVAWKWELIGGIIFIVIGLGLSPFVYSLNYNRTHSVGTSLEIILMITFPFVVVGILFLVRHWLKKHNQIKVAAPS